MTKVSVGKAGWEAPGLVRQAVIANLWLAFSGIVQLILRAFGLFHPWGIALQLFTAFVMLTFGLMIWHQVNRLQRSIKRRHLVDYLAGNLDHLIERLNKLDQEVAWIREFDLSDALTGDALLFPSRSLIQQIRENIQNSQGLLKQYRSV